MARESEAKIRFSVFNEDFKKGIQEITKETTTLRKEFKLEAEQMKHTASEMGKLEQNIKRLGAEKEQVRKKIELTEKQLAKVKEYYGENSEEARKLSNELLDLQISEKKIENAIQDSKVAIEKQTNAMEQSIPNAKKYRKSLSEIGKTAVDVGERIQNIGRGISSFGQSWSMRVTAPIVATGGAVFKLASDWESSWTGVEKVVDGTTVELNNLEKGLRDMTKELPATHQEIAEVAAAAGQLGIATGDIKDFTKVMLDLGESTNLTADEAATNLARFANITGMTADNYDRLGSTIVGLGNNLATTEKEIVEMAMRLAGAGAQIGMTEDQILSFAGALSSVGIEAEAGGSAFSKVMVNMQLATETGGKKLKEFAEVAGMSASDFKKAFKDDAAGAVIAFIEGLSTAEDRGKSAIGILNDMGLTEVRLRDALLRASGASDLFKDSLELGSKAWEENIALTEEAEKRYGTTESQLKIMWNRIKDTGITIGESLVPAVLDALDAAEPFIEKLKDGAEAFADLDEEQQRTILKLIALVAAIGPASMMLGGLTSTVGGLTKGVGGVIKLFGNARGAGLIGKIGMLGIGAGPVGLAVAGVTGLGLAIWALSDASNQSIEDTYNSIVARQEEIDSIDKLIGRFEELQRKNMLSTDEILRYMDIMDELKEAKSEEAIASLTDEQNELLEKSGMTNDEMQEFLDLNDEIIEKSPSTVEAISEQGNAYAGVLDELKKLNEYDRQILTQDTYLAITDELSNQTKNLEKQKELQQDISSLEEERKQKNQDLLQFGREIESVNNDIASIRDKMANATTIEEIDGYREKLAILEAEKNGWTQLRTERNEEIADIDKSINKKQEKLDKIAEELALFNDLADDYAQMVLYEQGIVSEKGKAVEALEQQQEELDKAREKLEKFGEEHGRTSLEYKEQNDLLNEQQKKIDTAKAKLKEMNEVAGQTIYKDLNIRTVPSIAKINEEIASDVFKRVKVGVDARYYQRLAYAKGTNYHPGGEALVGEEGPELIREGNKWSLADLGVYNLRRGAQVFTAEQTAKILKGIKRLPAYAGGAGITTEMAERLERISSGLMGKGMSSVFVTIEASDVIIDGRVAGQVLWKPIQQNIEKDTIQKERAKGRNV
jgi:TP901 family phage tail tape measure protein